MQRLAELMEKAIMDEKKIERLGIKKGIIEGENQEKRKIAKKMKEEGMDIETIKRITNLTEEINAL